VIQLRWTEQAVDDLREIRKYIERDSPRYGRLVVERLYEATQRLETFPRSGRVVPGFNLEHLERSSWESTGSSIVLSRTLWYFSLYSGLHVSSQWRTWTSDRATASPHRRKHGHFWPLLWKLAGSITRA
jgi:plasmid stabilization system protein ParE